MPRIELMLELHAKTLGRIALPDRGVASFGRLECMPGNLAAFTNICSLPWQPPRSTPSAKAGLQKPVFRLQRSIRLALTTEASVRDRLRAHVSMMQK